MTGIFESAPPASKLVTENTLRSRIAKAVSILRRDDFGNGALASLRRGGPRAVVDQPTFHRLIAEVDEGAEENKTFDSAIRWGTIIHAAALGARVTKVGDFPSSGKILAEAGLSEARFAKLLATTGDAFRDQIAIVARYLAAKQQPFIGTDLCELVIREGRWEQREDELRFAIAQHYYNSLARTAKAVEGASA